MLNFSRKNLWLVFPLLFVIGIALLWWYSPWRRDREEKAFRLLPYDSQFALHIGVAALRNNALVQQAFKEAQPHLDAEYADFVNGSGFNWETDLDSVDAAISGPPENRVINAVLTGRFHREKMDAYLVPRRKSSVFHASTNIEEYIGPSGRPVRIAFISGGRLLFSNAPDEKPIAAMIDLWRRSADSFGGRLRALGVFERIPAGTQIWAAADLERGARLTLPTPGSEASFSSELLRGSQVAIASAKLTAQSAELLVEARYPDDTAAERVVRGLAGLRSLLYALADRRASAGGSTEWQKALDHTSVSQNGQSAVVALNVDGDLLRFIFEQSAAASQTPPVQAATPPAEKKKK